MPRLTHHKAKQVSVNRRRHYELDGQRYPGITTILSATKPKEERDRLWAWKQRVGAAEATRITTTASRSGTKLHKLLRQHLQAKSVQGESVQGESVQGESLQPETPEIPEAVMGYWESIQPVLEPIQDILLVEGAIWHPSGFAGYPDALVLYNEHLSLCDWKTARRPKQAEWIEDYFMQIAAYVQGVNWVYQDEGIVVERGLVAIALDGQAAQTFPLGPVELEQYWQKFQKRLRQFYYRQGLQPPRSPRSE